MAKLREERGDKLTVAVVRRELRKWLCACRPRGRAVEDCCGKSCWQGG